MSKQFLRQQFAARKLRAADVGAHGGIVEHWLPFLEYLEVEAFEPNADDCARQQAASPPQVSWHPIGLAESTGTFDLYLLNRPTGSSLFPPNKEVLSRYSSEDYHGLKAVLKVPCMSLGDFFREKNRAPVHVLKMDTQGAELRILRGLRDQDWESLLAVETEVEFQELYEKQPLFTDVDSFMKSRGFELWDLRTHRAYHYRGNRPSPYIKDHLGFAVGSNKLSAQLVAGDALYFRRLETLNAELVAPALLTSLMYLAFDRFYRILETAAVRGWLSEADVRAWQSCAKYWAPTAWPWQRSVLFNKVVGKLNSILGTHWLESRQVFWTWRSWPDQ